MDAGSARNAGLDADVEYALAPLRKHRRRARMIFFIGSAVFAAMAAAVLWAFVGTWPEVAVSAALSILAGGAYVAHQPLAGIDKRIRRIVEPAILSPHNLKTAGMSVPEVLIDPFTQLGLVPAGESAQAGHRYESAVDDLWIEEVRIYDFGHDVVRNRHKRLVFFGQFLQRSLSGYDGEPFILLPRKYEISSQVRHQRDLFLGDQFLRSEHKDSDLSRHFQVWGRKSVAGDIVPPDICAAAIEAKACFPANQLAVAVTQRGEGEWQLRIIADIGALYRTERNLDAPLDAETLVDFQNKLKALMKAQAIMAAALSGQISGSAVK